MKKVNRAISEFDAAEYLKTQDDMIEYLSAAMEDGDEEMFLAALRDVAKAKEKVQIA